MSRARHVAAPLMLAGGSALLVVSAILPPQGAMAMSVYAHIVPALR